MFGLTLLIHCSGLVAALERLTEAPALERAVAASNRRQCLLCAGGFAAAGALNACGCLLGMLDDSPWVLDLADAATVDFFVGSRRGSDCEDPAWEGC
jgi:hypothetical protein